MEKYNRISKLTEEHLHGILGNLKMNYNKEHELQISIEYEDQNHYWFDYEVAIDLAKKRVASAIHQSEGHLNKIPLRRKQIFEQALQNIIVNS